MIIYTDKDLVDLIPLDDGKSFHECGIDENNIMQVFCLNKAHSFLTICNKELFSSMVKSEYEELTEEQSKVKINELEEIQKQEIDEAYKKTDAYKLKKLEEENASINYILMQNNLL